MEKKQEIPMGFDLIEPYYEEVKTEFRYSKLSLEAIIRYAAIFIGLSFVGQTYMSSKNIGGNLINLFLFLVANVFLFSSIFISIHAIYTIKRKVGIPSIRDDRKAYNKANRRSIERIIQWKYEDFLFCRKAYKQVQARLIFSYITFAIGILLLFFTTIYFLYEIYSNEGPIMLILRTIFCKFQH